MLSKEKLPTAEAAVYLSLGAERSDCRCCRSNNFGKLKCVFLSLARRADLTKNLLAVSHTLVCKWCKQEQANCKQVGHPGGLSAGAAEASFLRDGSVH